MPLPKHTRVCRPTLDQVPGTQAKIGFESVNDYVRSMVVEILVNDEEDSVLVDDGRTVGGWETERKDGFSKNV